MVAQRLEARVVPIINGTTTALFPMVGIVGDSLGNSGTGTLIGERFVLTAGHLAEDVSQTAGRFTVGGKTYHTSHIYLHPGYEPSRLGDDGADDIAIFELSEAVPNLDPLPLFQGTPQVGDMLTLIGFGAGGTGTIGSTGDFGTKRIGTTPIDRVSSTLLHWNFDNNSESNTAAGDSGGPALLSIDGSYFIAGITSGGELPDASLGDQSYDTRVDAYLDWIDSIINPTPVDPTPDPASLRVVASSNTQLEGTGAASPFSFSIIRDGDTTEPITVSYAFSGGATFAADAADFGGTFPSGTVTIDAGQTTKLITVWPSADASVESDESFVITLSNPSTGSLAQPTVEVTLEDDDATIAFVDHGALTIQDADVRNSQITVSYSLSNSEYTLSSPTPIFLADNVPSSSLHFASNLITSVTAQLGSGNDVLDLSALTIPSTIYGGSGNDTLLGGSLADWIFGGVGDDSLTGNEGADFLSGELGNDRLTGDSGDDTLNGDGGHDWVSGGDGEDAVYGQSGNDTLSGGPANDTIGGGSGFDTLLEVTDSAVVVVTSNAVLGLNGIPTESLAIPSTIEALHLIGGASANKIDASQSSRPITIEGGLGNDTLIGSRFADLLIGGSGRDSLIGNAGQDTLNGGAGNDFISGGDDADSLIGGTGSDTLQGDTGADSIRYDIYDRLFVDPTDLLRLQ